jgi:NADPH:quinone reductase-like Zn-dependent oxidoreductase
MARVRPLGIDEPGHVVREAAGEAGKFRAVVLAPVGERLVEQAPAAKVDRLDQAVALRRGGGGLDAAVARRRRPCHQAKLLEPVERATDLRVVLLQALGKLEDTDRAAKVHVDQAPGELGIQRDARAVEKQPPKGCVRRLLEQREPNIVEAVVRHPFSINASCGTLPMSVHCERIRLGGAEAAMDKRHMYAAVLHGIGRTPRCETFPVPDAGPDEALLTVAAAALKPSDRLMAGGVHYAPTAFPTVVGLDGVGRLEDGTRVAFMVPQRPYGGMAEQTLVRRGMWLPVPEGLDDITAAAVLNPGMAAWKSVIWEGRVAAGKAVLILGATGTSGRIAAQLAVRRGARTVVAGRRQHILDELVAGGADVAIRVDRQAEELAGAIARAGPYDLVIDYLWGGPAEAAFQALSQMDSRPGTAPVRTRYILVGMSAGETAALPAMALRRAPVEVVGSGVDGPVSPAEAAAAYGRLVEQVAAGEIVVDVQALPLAAVEKAWQRSGTDHRMVFVP